MRRRAYCLLTAALALAACSGDRYRVVQGPARMTIGETIYSPPILVEIEEGGHAYFGPSSPLSGELPTVEPK